MDFRLKARPSLLALAGLALLLAGLPASALADTSATPVRVDLPSGTYLAELPARGGGPMPLVVFIHGWKESAASMMTLAGLAETATSRGALFVVPDGRDGSWSFHGVTSRSGRDDVAFLRQVIDDARRRWPVDPAQIVVSGFSIGATMVWELACHAPEGIAAFLPISGTLWRPLPERCTGGPVALRQVHGTNDHTFPLEGRALGPTFHQGDTREGLALLRDLDRCPATPDTTSAEGRLICQSWTSCGAGRLQLCLHNGDHELDPAFLASGLDWALGRQ